MPVSANEFTAAIDAVENWIKTATDTPFATGEVEASGWALHPDQIGTRLEQCKAPGAVIYFGGGEANGGFGGSLVLDPGICVAVVARGRSAPAASQGDDASYGLTDLIKFVRGLHGQCVTGLQNPLYLVGVQPFVLPWRALTVAAVVLRFKTDLVWAENLV